MLYVLSFLDTNRSWIFALNVLRKDRFKKTTPSFNENKSVEPVNKGISGFLKFFIECCSSFMIKFTKF